MARTSTVIDVPTEAVWDTLADGWLYTHWVVGAIRIREVDPHYPASGSTIASTVWFEVSQPRQSFIGRVFLDHHQIQVPPIGQQELGHTSRRGKRPVLVRHDSPELTQRRYPVAVRPEFLQPTVGHHDQGVYIAPLVQRLSRQRSKRTHMNSFPIDRRVFDGLERPLLPYTFRTLVCRARDSAI